MCVPTGIPRREFASISAAAGLTTLIATALGENIGMVKVAHAAHDRSNVSPFCFAIVSDSHLFSAEGHKFDFILSDAVERVMALKPAPDFVVYCGDMAQNGRLDQMEKGKKILSRLPMPIHFIPGEHDWYLDLGVSFTGLFGTPPWSFNHKGIHFIGMTSILVRDFWTPAHMSPLERMQAMEMLESPIAGPWGVREQQLEWLKKDVRHLRGDAPVVIFTHSPLWDYYPRWNFQTEDGPEVRQILSKFNHIMSFHGHVHQTIFNRIGNLSSIGSLSTCWPWPYPEVHLAYPESRMHRVDPANIEDGMGMQHIDLMENFKGRMQWDPFVDGLLDDKVAHGFPI